MITDNIFYVVYILWNGITYTHWLLRFENIRLKMKMRALKQENRVVGVD